MLVIPRPVENRPAAHRKQSDSAVPPLAFRYLPATQDWQTVVAGCAAYLPAAQATQVLAVDAPATLENLPTEQATQSADEFEPVTV